MRKHIVPAAKRVGADLLDFAMPEVNDAVKGKNFNNASKSVGRQTLRKQLEGGKQKRSSPIKKLKGSSRSRRFIFTNFEKYLMTDLNNFWKQLFVTVSVIPGVKVRVLDDLLSSHEQEIYPTTYFIEKSIEFEFETDRNFHVDLRQTYLALKIKLVKRSGFNT